MECCVGQYASRSLFDTGATGQNNALQCEYFSLLMMNRSGLEQSVVRTGLWARVLSWSGQPDCWREGEERTGGRERERRHHFWWLRGGGGRLHMKPWPQKMDKTIAWKLAGEGGTAWCVLGLLDNTEVEGGRKKKWENGDVVRGRREEEPEWGIIIIKNKINRPWGSEQWNNNGIQVFEDKTAALIEALQLTSCEKQREEISFLVGGGG